MDELVIDEALILRVKGRLPDDPAKDTEEQADLRKLIMVAGMAALLGGQALQALKGAEELLGGLTKPFGALAQSDMP